MAKLANNHIVIIKVSVEKLKFSVLNHTFDSSVKDISFDEYFSLFELSNCATKLSKKDFFLIHFNARSLKHKSVIDKSLNDKKRQLDVIAVSET